ncbi:hypothetical protein UFOVP43_25 [uncultured Caudovirales phage]|uniref:Uncharacterized protein n=1 Tax=uncultured Caudovirales phage TaxID=2100421 RepID=A0A6J5KM83_9CAUD|nr:hypothetical protein UFOVP43_25 [uncultured Caudovirales phage]
MTHTEALKQALEALENTTPTGFNMERDKQFFVAITAIKEALAQPQQEPVAWVCYGFSDGEMHDIDFEQKDVDALPVGTMLYTFPQPAQPQQEPDLAEAFRTELDKLSQRNYKLRMENAGLKAQPEQEPVAWMVTTEMQDGTKKTYPLTGLFKDVKDVCDFDDPIPLYTTPPQRTWVGLTDEEALECWPGLAMYADCVKFWENIEAKLKDKNI